MDHTTQVQLSKQVLAHLEAGTTDLAAQSAAVPITTYTSNELLQQEQNVLFRQYPLMLCLSCQISNPGDYLTEDKAGVPIIIVRGLDGVARAFLNVCRHRGARLAEGQGNTKRRLVCPYHAWSYDLDGTLAGIPHSKDAFPDLDRSCHGLQVLPIEEKYGMIFVTPTATMANNGGQNQNIDDHLAGLGPELENYGFADYHHYQTREMRLKFNWKLVVDTFLEPYHFGFLHRDSIAPIFVPNLCLLHPFGLNLRETLPRRSIVEMNEEPESEWDLIKHSAMVYVLFPNTVVVMQADHLETWRIYPVKDKTDESITCLDFYIPEPADTDSAIRHWNLNMDLVLRTVEEEDFPTMTGIQKGLLSGAQEEITFGRNEPALIHWRQSCRKAMTS